MKIDFYTKMMLTIIAVSLSVIAFKPSVSYGTSLRDVQKVVICDSSGFYCAGVGALDKRLAVDIPRP
jgi:hypothetical protein